MTHIQKPKPGAYRELFLRALTFYEENSAHTPEELHAIQRYRALLCNPDYKFGKVNHSGMGYAPGELFLRS